MRRETADRVSLTIDRELLAWYDHYCRIHDLTKSQFMEILIKELQKIQDNDEKG